MIEVTNLTKDFKIQTREKGLLGAAKSLFSSQYTLKRAVDDISFTIGQGEIVSYIGPNGAGKSTTIKMLVGILVPTSGSVEVNRLKPYEDRIENARNMGVVFGQRTQLWWDIPVESLYYDGFSRWDAHSSRSYDFRRGSEFLDRKIQGRH